MKTVLMATALIAILGSTATTAGAKDKPKKDVKEKAKTEKSEAIPAAPAPTKGEEAPATTENKGEAAAPGGDAKDDHTIQMRGLEERVNDLKEKIFRSKARLMLLRETVLNGSIAGAKAVLIHRNEMGGAFVLESVSYALDGAPIYTKADTNGDLSGREEIELFNSSIVPGNHNLAVNMVYRGSGFGIFSYFKGYKFRIKSSYAFTAEEGKITAVKVVGYEKGGFTTDLADRPAIRYDVDVKQDNASGPAPGTDQASGPAAAPAKP